MPCKNFLFLSRSRALYHTPAVPYAIDFPEKYRYFDRAKLLF